MYKAENHHELLALMDEVVCPDVNPDEVTAQVADALRQPDYSYYDRACRVVRGFGQGGSLNAFAWRWYNGTTNWRVDTFHFLCHLAHDMQCRCARVPMTALWQHTCLAS